MPAEPSNGTLAALVDKPPCSRVSDPQDGDPCFIRPTSTGIVPRRGTFEHPRPQTCTSGPPRMGVQ